MEATTLADLFTDVLGEAKDEKVKNIVSDSERRLTHWLMRLRRLKPRHFATKKKRARHLKTHSAISGQGTGRHDGLLAIRAWTNTTGDTPLEVDAIALVLALGGSLEEAEAGTFGDQLSDLEARH